MQILFKVDQKTALLRGIDAPASTVKLDVDPATLTDTERSVLAAVLEDGHKATDLGLAVMADGFVGIQFSRWEPRTNTLVLKRPDLIGLREAIADMLAELERMRADTLEKRSAVWAENHAKMEAHMAAPPVEHEAHLLLDGTVKSSPGAMTVRYLARDATARGFCSRDLSPEDAAMFERWRAETYAANQAALQEAIVRAEPELARLRAAKLAENEAEQRQREAATAQRAAMIARFPAAFQGRIRDGYVGKDEVSQAIKDQALADAGLSGESYCERQPLNTLTNAEYDALTQVKRWAVATLPSAVVTPVKIATRFGKWRKATESDPEDAIDEDGEVWDEPVALRRRIEIRWSSAGEDVVAMLPFDTQIGMQAPA